MHTRCAWHKPRTSWVEIVLWVRDFLVLGLLPATQIKGVQRTRMYASQIRTLLLLLFFCAQLYHLVKRRCQHNAPLLVCWLHWCTPPYMLSQQYLCIYMYKGSYNMARYYAWPCEATGWRLGEGPLCCVRAYVYVILQYRQSQEPLH